MTQNSIFQSIELARALSLQDSFFQIVDTMGGGMGTCFKIYNNEAQKYYVLKTIHHEMVKNDKAWFRFIEEIKTWFALSECGGILDALCVITLDEIPYMCSPWMEEGTLDEYIGSGKMQKKDYYSTVVL